LTSVIADMGKTTVLVVDDSPSVLKTVAAVFKAKEPSVELLAATSGKEALNLMAASKPDLVLLDIMMPEIDGWMVATSMKKDENLKDVPVVYLTAKNDQLSLQMGKLSAEDYIVKPFEGEDLVRRVRAVLAKIAAKKKRLEAIK
jgi:DNA-binding response OmpR family regulator